MLPGKKLTCKNQYFHVCKQSIRKCQRRFQFQRINVTRNTQDLDECNFKTGLKHTKAVLNKWNDL